jgi:5-hydroxyisourate hydrolase
MGITTHVLDTATGRPAANVPVRLELADAAAPGGWRAIGAGRTDDDGRLKTLLPAGAAAAHGTYRISFETAAYLGDAAFFPEVQIVFVVRDDRHHHVPLLLSPYAYSTYRGS